MAEQAAVLPINERKRVGSRKRAKIRLGCHVLKVGSISEEFYEQENLVLDQFWE